jgi:hypothetical protein
MKFEWVDSEIAEKALAYSCNKVIKHIVKPIDYIGTQKVVDDKIYALYTEYQFSGYFECYLEDILNEEIRNNNRKNPNNWYIRHDQIK